MAAKRILWASWRCIS